MFLMRFLRPSWPSQVVARTRCRGLSRIRYEAGLQCDLLPLLPSRHMLVLSFNQVAQDIIWVWGDAGPDANLESALAPMPLIRELEDDMLATGRVAPLVLSHRDLAYGWDTLIENLVVRARFLSPRFQSARFPTNM